MQEQLTGIREATVANKARLLQKNKMAELSVLGRSVLRHRELCYGGGKKFELGGDKALADFVVKTRKL